MLRAVLLAAICLVHGLVGHPVVLAQRVPYPDNEQNLPAMLETANLLRTCARRLELYRTQHSGAYPDFQQWPNWEQMTMVTRVDGTINAGGTTGGYLPRPPDNPLRGASRVAVVAQESVSVSDAKVGWAFIPDGRIRAVNERGKIVSAEDLELRVVQYAKAATRPMPGRKGPATASQATKGRAPITAAIADLLHSPDPEVRRGAVELIGITTTVDAEILIEIAGLMETDPSGEVRKSALGKTEELGVRRRIDRFALLDLDTIVPGLIAAASDLDPAIRRRAVIVLGYLREQSSAALAMYSKCLNDPDPTVQAASVERVCLMLHENRGKAELLGLFRDALAKPGATRDTAAHGLTWMLYSSELAAEVLKLAASADADSRAMGAVVAGVVFHGPDAKSKLGNVSAEDVAAGVQHRLAWVRAYATEHLFQDHPHWKLDGKAILLAAVAHTDPDVASDAARRLCGDLPLGAPLGGGSSVIGESETARRRKSAEESPLLSEYVTLCRSRSASQRLRGITGLAGRGEAALGAIPVLAELFADPAPNVRQASRKAAIHILTPAKIPGVRFQ